MLEILRGKWRLNFENIKIDHQGLIHDGQHRLVGLVFGGDAWAGYFLTGDGVERAAVDASLYDPKTKRVISHGVKR